MPDNRDIENFSRSDSEDPKVMILNTASLGLPERKPLTAKDVAWKTVWALVFFLLIVLLAGLVVAWLWNENLAGVTGLPEIELRTAISGIILFRLASFIWRM